MNYFAHGHRFTDDPYLLAGTAVPDWLSVVHRRARTRRQLAAPFVDDADQPVAALARGILQHHDDDRWFHRTRAFMELHLQLTTLVRDQLPSDDGFRPSVVGHILVEVLLDAALIAEAPDRLATYYQALEQVDPDLVGRAVSRMTTEPTGLLSTIVYRFSQERFLYDYLDDEKLLWRLNRVMRRAKLPPLPERLIGLLPAARQAVGRRKTELLEGGDAVGAPASAGN